MTLEEIHKELHEDFRSTRAQLNNRVEKFKGVVLKSSRFPVRRHYECKSLQKKNRFYVQLTALKRGEFKNPLFDYYCIFDRSEPGMTTAESIERLSQHSPWRSP